jgi:hypothetical protein
MLTKLESLVGDMESSDTIGEDNEDEAKMKPRAGKTLSPELAESAGRAVAQLPGLVVAKVQSTNQTIHLFSAAAAGLHMQFNNLEQQIFSELQARHRFLEVISGTIGREMGTFRNTVSFLQRLVNFKLDQSEILLGSMHPITEILQSGSTSIFLLITRFFEAVEAVFSLKREFTRAFSGESMGRQEVGLLERIRDLKLKLLPGKIRLLLNIHAHSNELGDMVSEIFRCVGELLEAKQDLIASVGVFVEQKVMTYWSGLITIPRSTSSAAWRAPR